MFCSGCGYDHIQAGSKTRKQPLDYTGCLAHVEITYYGPSRKVLRIRGYLLHNQGCITAKLARLSAVPLHPSVYEEAIRQLKAGAGLTEIQEQNDKWVDAKTYSAMRTTTGMSSYRWKLEQKDTRSLFRKFSRISGVNVREQAHINIDEWLDPTSRNYNAVLAEAIFHYSARAEKNERFEISVATNEMCNAAWKYGHKSQIILDGTFGVCNRKILLFIIMGIDSERKGVPLAFLFFSAPSGCKHSSSGYNTEILARLLSSWRDSLGKRDDKPFDVSVAITDTDLKERGALVLVFPNIWLLICKFHLRQSWRNRRNKILKGKSPTHLILKGRIRSLEEHLVRTLTIEEARSAIATEVAAVCKMQERYSQYTSLLKKTIKHLEEYLLRYWTTESMWRSWSDFGRQVASKILNCPFEGVLPTTNHLESFNGLLKRKHLKHWQRNGRRLRLDTLIHLLVTKILPSVFNYRARQKRAVTHWEGIISALPGGEALLRQRNVATQSARATAVNHAAYLQPDVARDAAAAELLNCGQIGVPSVTETNDGFVFTCFSSLAMTAAAYIVYLGCDRTAHCTCPDFLGRGGACKHLRAALLQMDLLRNTGLSLPLITLPESPENAQTLQSSRLEAALQAAKIFQPDLSAVEGDALHDAATAVEQVLEDVSGERDTEIDSDVDMSGGSESDNESVATDASDPDDTEQEADMYTASDTNMISVIGRSDDGGSDVYSVMSVDSLDWAGTAKHGVEQQAVARSLFDLDYISSDLDSLTTQLRAASQLTNDKDVQRTKTYLRTIQALAGEMERLIATGPSVSVGDSVDPGASDVDDAEDNNKPTVEHPKPQKKIGRKIIPPSPEKAEKRKQSYGHH